MYVRYSRIAYRSTGLPPSKLCLRQENEYLRIFSASHNSGGRPAARASLVWRRGRAFEVALRCFARAPTRGPRPLVPSLRSGHPMKGAHPLHNPRSNPALYLHRSSVSRPSRILARLALCWRRGRDLNPRQGFWPCDGLANRCLRPLGHLSVTLRRGNIQRANIIK